MFDSLIDKFTKLNNEKYEVNFSENKEVFIYIPIINIYGFSI